MGCPGIVLDSSWLLCSINGFITQVLLSIFYSLGNRGTKQLNDLPKVTLLVSSWGTGGVSNRPIRLEVGIWWDLSPGCLTPASVVFLLK